MAAYAALVSLMNNIEQIQRHTRLPITFDRKQSESLLENVNVLIDFLESYHYHGAGQEMEDLESRITDAAYAAEDIIETHVVDKIHDYSSSSKGVNKIIAPIRGILRRMKNKMLTEKNPYLPGIDKVIENMDFIKEEAMKIKNRRGIDGSPTMSTVIDAPSSSTILVGKNGMVGFEEELKELLERLPEQQSRRRQIIPVVGMGGIGKTTLAKTAYDEPYTVGHFDFRAWVSISQEYDFKRIVLGLLPNESSQMSDNELAGRLYKNLCGRRYLVVLDDMWSVDAWDTVNRFLPDDKNGSRIIVTTRDSNVATHLDTCSLKMNFLNEENGWILFCRKVFAQECCPREFRELEEVGRDIVKNCQGLPLSIVVIGGLLAKSERTTKYWEYIARNTSAVVGSEGDEMCMKILYLSYHNLPVHLKPCFLYMGIFAEDEKIKVNPLIKLWVAEGFLKPNSSKELEVVANEYLNDLISRNLIIVHGHGSRGNIKDCMIHDLLRNLCLKEAHKGKFLYVPTMHVQDDVQNIGNQRRISIPTLSNIPKHLGTPNPGLSNIPKHLGTLNPGFLGRSLICAETLPLENSRLLRVLQGCDVYQYKLFFESAKYPLDETFKLVNLRLISIGTIKPLIKFPCSIYSLWNLQILIISNFSAFAPLEIWEMTQLRHLQFLWSFFDVFKYGFRPGQQIKTEGGVAIMKNLHTLKGITDLRLSYEFVKRIPNVKTLKLYYHETRKECGFQYLKLFENLESLRLKFNEDEKPDRLPNLIFPDSLKKLTLQACSLQWENMSMIASLPLLQVLKLKYAFKGPKWEVTKEGFPCLKYLQIGLCDLEEWIANDTHFPCLEHLRLVRLDKLVKIPSSIGDIPTLRKIELVECSNSAVNSAKKILDEQEDFGNLNLKVEVACSKDAELESLASANFIVRARGETWPSPSSSISTD